MGVRRHFAARIACGSILLALAADAALAQRPYPILFVTQVPIPYDFTAVASVFGNHQPALGPTGRGGDLYILYPDGTLKNLTGLAGHGVANGFQGPTSIAVREPAVHWSGTKAVFSMVVGAPHQQYLWQTYYWQLYEVSGLGPSDTPEITKVANQPANANNVSPAYLSDGRIAFTSDRSRDGRAHLYPQLDEYEEAPTVSGLWALDPATGKLALLDHAPSGDFRPTVDSFGRVIFTRWDHLQRDQQADSDNGGGVPPGGSGGYGTFNWSSEAPNSVPLASRAEVFPEPRYKVGNAEAHTFNHFFPWMINQDGTELETLNHIGRHDLHDYFNRSFDDDPNLDEFIFDCDENGCTRTNEHDILNFLQIRESPTVQGRYFGVDAPEFYTHAAGQVLWMPGEPSRLPDDMPLTEITHPATEGYTEDDETAPPCHSGLYRNPLPLSDGTIVAVHAGERSPGVPETRADSLYGGRATPQSRYSFRLRELVPAAAPCAGFSKYGAALTGSGIAKTLSYWDPDVFVQYTDVTMWELDPVEVRALPVPPAPAGEIPAVEAGVFASAGVDQEEFRQRLADNNLALIVSRDVTTRDKDDRQQPFNLRVPGGTAQTTGAPGKIYDVEYLQLFQGDLLRGTGGNAAPDPGRRVLAQVMHDPAVRNPPLDPGDPPGSVEVADDGSIAALVPSHRALTWQLTSGAGNPVVRERYWLTFAPGEVRVCASCHGASSQTQAGNAAPGNVPQALQQFLAWWQSTEILRSGFELGTTAVWSTATP